MTEVVPVPVRLLDPDLPMPAYAHPGDAGADLCAAEDVELAPGARGLVRTGVAVALPDGFVGLVHPRSGLAARLGVTVLNAPGTVDAGYRGEILVNLINHDPAATVRIRRGDRIAQLLLQRVERARFIAVDELPDSVRGTGGHGSTGGHLGLPTQPTAPVAPTAVPERA
ncbi:MAG TPA: dUTP diphosphatase [Actinoplanes sp.]|nr:dUTP diphosphatase [Actinoplanes sp.]